MKRVCAWCKEGLGSSVVPNEPIDAPITHGICADCLRKMMSFEATPLRSFLNTFSKPVFLVNYDFRIVTENTAALSLLNKIPENVDGKLGGNVFGCKYADLPGGCGNTVHCKTCTIRLSVTDTLQTGKSNVEIPAYPDLHHMTGEYRVRFLISTELVGEAVLLRIDDSAEEK